MALAPVLAAAASSSLMALVRFRTAVLLAGMPTGGVLLPILALAAGAATARSRLVARVAAAAVVAAALAVRLLLRIAVVSRRLRSARLSANPRLGRCGW